MTRATAEIAATPASARLERWYRTVWRWHFYAGMFTIPLILWLSATGAIYLFKPQIETLLDSPYDHLAVSGVPAAPAALAARANTAVPGAALHRFVLSEQPDNAQRVIVGVGSDETRVYLHPDSGEILKTVGEEDRLMRVIFRLHGELMAGRFGSTIVELAASWAIVMLLTGLYLWWPRDREGLGGILYPRIGRTGSVFWRDLHAVTGIWVSVFAVILILSGLPWAKSWGDYLGSVREATGQVNGPADWSRGSDSDARERAALDRRSRAALGEHAGHMGGTIATANADLAQLDVVVPAARRLALPAPVEISPPAPGTVAWTVQSNSANRPLRTTIRIDGRNGEILGRTDFRERHWIDRLVGYGIAWHEGALFGLANQLFGLTTLIALVTLAISSVVLWWRRRPAGRLGAPTPKGRMRHSWLLVGAVIALALLLPLFGMSLAVVVLVERMLLRRSERIGGYLSLRA